VGLFWICGVLQEPTWVGDMAMDCASSGKQDSGVADSICQGRRACRTVTCLRADLSMSGVKSAVDGVVHRGGGGDPW